MIRTEPIEKWVRGRLGGRLVVETYDPLLVWQGPFPPVYAVTAADLVDATLEPVDAPPPGGFDFFGPQAPVSQWWDLVVDGHRVPLAAWTLDDDAVRDRVVVTWRPGVLDWTEEDEPVASHPRDPHKRVEALASSRHVEVSIDGVVVAASDRPVLLLETGLPTRYYLPREDVRLDLLTPTDHETHCPYKGRADSYWTWAGPPALANVAWSYSSPAGAVAAVAGLVAFYDELVDVDLDGVRRDRPVSPFSEPEQRSGSDG